MSELVVFNKRLGTDIEIVSMNFKFPSYNGFDDWQTGKILGHSLPSSLSK